MAGEQKSRFKGRRIESAQPNLTQPNPSALDETTGCNDGCQRICAKGKMWVPSWPRGPPEPVRPLTRLTVGSNGRYRPLLFLYSRTPLHFLPSLLPSPVRGFRGMLSGELTDRLDTRPGRPVHLDERSSYRTNNTG